MTKKDIKLLYYIAKIDELEEILSKGLLKEKNGAEHHKSFIPLYLNPKNAKTYSFIHHSETPIVLLGISSCIIENEGNRISLGPGDSPYSTIFDFNENILKQFNKNLIYSEDWSFSELKKNMMLSQFLCDQDINKDKILKVFIPEKYKYKKHDLYEKVIGLCQKYEKELETESSADLPVKYCFF